MAKIGIRSFEIKNYRTITKATLDFSQGAVGLIGVNASGKTNIGRAFEFFCTLIKTSLPHIGGPSNANTELEEAEWPPLNKIEPTSILFRAVAGQKMILTSEFEVPSFLVPTGKGHVLQQLSVKGETYTLIIQTVLEARNLPTGNLSLVPSFQVTIDGKMITRADVQQLKGLWPQISGSRLQALRPAQDFLNAMNKLRNKSTAGHNAFEKINDSVTEIEGNFARVSFINNTPMAIEGDISDLSVENMSTGNLRALQLLSVTRNPELDAATLIHIEEPETHFHPTLQRQIVRSILEAGRAQDVGLIIETHSPQILRELFAADVPVYRIEVKKRDTTSGVRQSVVEPLLRGEEATKLLSEMGVDTGFALLGGVVLITDGVTDPPAYREFLSKFPELADLLTCFLPIGCLESKGLDFKDLAKLAEHIILLADGHFREKHGPRLKQKCKNAGIDFIQLDHWGVENFFTLEALQLAQNNTSGLTVDSSATLEPMTSLKDTEGVSGFSKNHHMALTASHMTKEDLEKQKDFMTLVQKLKKLK